MNQYNSLLSMNPGEKAVIKGFKGSDIACNFLKHGILPNSNIEFVRWSPLKDSVCIKMDDYFLAIRYKQASELYIEKINAS